jgi:glycosyltransferase involved in cell wall biosynthesis
MVSDVSVVIPTFDDAQYLERCLASIWAQTLAPREVIIVDDGSSDPAALAALKRVVASYPLVRLIRQSNAGPSAARNAGLAAVTGKWVAFVDADDELTPDSLKIRRARLAADHRAKASYCAVCFVEPDGRTHASGYRTGSMRLNSDWIGARGGVPGFLWAYLVEVEAIRRAGGLNPALKIMEDFDLLARLGRDGACIIGDARTGYIQHRRQGSLARGSAWRQIRGTLRFLAVARKEHYFSCASLLRRYAYIPVAGLKVAYRYGSQRD